MSTAKLINMLDFSKADFKKEINTFPRQKVKSTSKWEMVKLGYVSNVLKGKSLIQKDTVSGNIKVVAGGKIFAYLYNISNQPKNTITISASGVNSGYVNFWQEALFASDCTTITDKNSFNLIPYFIFVYLKSIQNEIFYLARGSAQPHVYHLIKRIF